MSFRKRILEFLLQKTAQEQPQETQVDEANKNVEAKQYANQVFDRLLNDLDLL